MFIGIVAVELAQAVVTAWGLAAFSIQLFDVDLTHVSIVADVGLAVVGNDCFLIDPPVCIGAFDLQFPIKLQPVANFGGIKHYAASDTSHTTELKPVYDDEGAYTGYMSADGTETDKIAEAETVVVDPNENIVAVVAQRGVIFETKQNELRVRAIFNPSGEYQNTFFNEMNNGINYDHTKNLITISKPSE